jgi:hypothetical protein
MSPVKVMLSVGSYYLSFQCGTCTRMDCWRRTEGEHVGKAPHTLWSPNIPPKQLPLAPPLPKRA